MQMAGQVDIYPVPAFPFLPMLQGGKTKQPFEAVTGEEETDTEEERQRCLQFGICNIAYRDQVG